MTMLLRELGPIRQVAYVVRDIKTAMAHWTNVLGVGPFFYFEEAPIEDFHYRGMPTSAKLSVAFSNSGPMQIELIQPLDEHPSVFNDFRRAGLEGNQHIAFWTRELDAWRERCSKAGVAEVMSGYTGAKDGRFFYVAVETHPGMSVEISEVQGRKSAFFAEVARSCEGWDGRDSIRRLGI
jgi:Glyoxalase/Bleomycin resistance protein/Dioxygenase superfamily